MIAAARLHAAALVLVFWAFASALGAAGNGVTAAILLSLALGLVISTEERTRRDR